MANVFNHYDIVVQPNATTGLNTLNRLGATFYQQPRAYVWTNSIKF